MINFNLQIAYIFAHYSKLLYTDVRSMIIKTLMFWGVFVVFVIIFVNTPNPKNNSIAAFKDRGGFMFIFMLYFLWLMLAQQARRFYQQNEFL